MPRGKPRGIFDRKGFCLILIHSLLRSTPGSFAALDFFLLPVSIRIGWLLWPMLFIWGGAAFGVYTVALAGLGDRYSGPMLLTGSAAFGLMWGLGGIVGPASTGVAMQLWGPAVMPFTLAVPFVLFTCLLLFRRYFLPAAAE